MDVPILIKEQVQEKTMSDFLYGLSYPGRIIITLYTLHGLFFIYNLVIQFIILIPSLLYILKIHYLLKIFFAVYYVVFAISSSNILVIPTYEFFSFPFLLIKNPFSHLISFIYIHKGKEFNETNIKNKDLFINIILIIFEIIYFTSLLSGYFLNIIKFKDVVKLIILILIYFYYITLVFLYFFTSLYLFIMNIKKIIICKYWRKTIKSKYDNNEVEIPDINLLNYLIKPFLFKFYKRNNINIIDNIDNSYYAEDFIYDAGILIKFVLLILSIIVIPYFLLKIIDFWFGFLCFLIFLLIITILSLGLNFPFCYRNRKTFGIFGCCCNFLCFKKKNNLFFTNIKYSYKPLHPTIISFTRFISDTIILLVSIALLYIHFLNDDNNDINDNIFGNVFPTDKTIDTKKYLLPNICYSSVHNMPLHLFLPFINDAYYYNNFKNNEANSASSFDIDNYKQLFFNDDYKIEVIGNLTNEDDSVKMIQYNVRNKKNFITILAIKGTSYNKDIYLDMQLYFSSILLNLLSSFSILTEKNSLTFRLIEYGLNIPYRLFFTYLIINKYIEKLQDAYYKNQEKIYRNVVIVGHSLGGGLAKLFGRIIGKQAISLSGPGINAFHSLWNYKGKSENFGMSAIDLVPDKDMVPRVEVSGGTIYRILCKEGVFNCHSKHASLCEVLIMCRNPNYYPYCKEVAKFTDERIKEIMESSELNNN